jgi:methyl-accepting chemotaxis protein
MTSSFSRSASSADARAIITATVMLLVCAAAAEHFGVQRAVYAALALSAAAVIYLFVSGMNSQGALTTNDAQVLDRIEAVCRDVADGNAHARIIDIAETGRLAEVQKAFNAAIERSAELACEEQARVIDRIATVCQQISQGNSEARITDIKETGDLAGVQQAVNAAIERSAELAREEQARVLDRIATVCQQISQGNFEARIIDIRETGDLAGVQQKVNDMIDRCDAFVREATASLDAVCRNIYYRRILLGGLNGAFYVAATKINSSVEEQKKAIDKAKADAAAEQARIVAWLRSGLQSLAAGDLLFRLDDYSADYRMVRDEFNETMDRLLETIQATRYGIREVANASAEIATSTTDLSQRTEEQAASLEETSASMEQISATVKKNAENAQQANQSAGATREVADRGGQVVAKAVEAMAKIEGSSRKISDIIGVIDEIARQTNLLALNAAVEAARAGEAGRGFAVVASEVRSLAQRSSQAAKDIKDLITSSNDQVKDGVELVNRAGSALTDIVDSIKGVAEIVADIANASAEQADGIDQINKALTQMDEMTQQNSALVEENAATAKTLEGQSAAMSEQVAYFKVEAEAAGEPAAVKSAARAAA